MLISGADVGGAARPVSAFRSVAMRLRSWWVVSGGWCGVVVGVWQADTEYLGEQFHIVPIDSSRFELAVIPDLFCDGDARYGQVFDGASTVEPVKGDDPAATIEHRAMPGTIGADSQRMEIHHLPRWMGHLDANGSVINCLGVAPVLEEARDICNLVRINVEVEVVMLTGDSSYQGIDSPATGNPVCDPLALQKPDQSYDIISGYHAQPPLIARICTDSGRASSFRHRQLERSTSITCRTEHQ